MSTLPASPSLYPELTSSNHPTAKEGPALILGNLMIQGHHKSKLFNS